MRHITYYRDRIRIDKHRLDDEMATHSEMLEEIGRAVSGAAKREAVAKRELEQTEARLLAEMFDEDPKLPVNRAVIDVKRKREWEQKHDQLLNYRQDLAEWEALEKAWYGRGFDLRALGELWSKQYVAGGSMGTVERPQIDRSEYLIRRTTKARRTALADE